MENNRLKRYKKIGLILYLLITALLIISLLIAYPNTDSDLERVLGMVLITIVFCIIAFFLYLAPIILGIIGIVTTCKTIEKGKRGSNIVFFVFLILLPIITDFLVLISTLIIL